MDSPAIRVLASDGHIPSEQPGARITYWGQRLRVSLNSGLTHSDPDEFCVDVGPLLLVPGGFFGVSAATGTLADDHDVLSFLTFSLSEPSPEVPPQPFLEMQQLRLARQLEGLRARLGLGTREDVTPKSDSEAQGEGERLFDLEETLGRHRGILQALWGLSKQLAQAERQWKKQLGPLGQARPDGGWALDASCQIPSTPGRGGHLSMSLNKDSAKVGALLHGQWTLLQALQEMRDAAVRMAAEAQVSYLPVGTEHHFLELDHILGLLQEELRGPAQAGAEQEPSGVSVHRQPSSGSCTTHPQGPGDSEGPCLSLPACLPDPPQSLLCITGKQAVSWVGAWSVSSPSGCPAPTHT
ncbi:LMAN1L isoform 8 [Pan troglodytes]|uniref:LMAN1L isoform 8 n=1 Tax=Pan troglodytes TaxID=9598 RepID=A0A2J8KRX4_PANTR|nr:LMAN1L isoform 8 [Pan troglodytes]